MLLVMGDILVYALGQTSAGLFFAIAGNIAGVIMVMAFLGVMRRIDK